MPLYKTSYNWFMKCESAREYGAFWRTLITSPRDEWRRVTGDRGFSSQLIRQKLFNFSQILWKLSRGWAPGPVYLLFKQFSVWIQIFYVEKIMQHICCRWCCPIKYSGHKDIYFDSSPPFWCKDSGQKRKYKINLSPQMSPLVTLCLIHCVSTQTLVLACRN